ncbi:MAG: glutamine--fructose-6-phosphate aminotransferase, partial [Candidatus Dormibacteraeota bacterium]|nr:glutamine--fructose-6-phosphate aminotransferase [Candidatus Dormibacteraeota bacterium]
MTVLLDALSSLEYRGYDSAGIAVLDTSNVGVHVIKDNHKVVHLAREVESRHLPDGRTGIGHTRWATHGRPTALNAHPHSDCTGRLHVIHNGIVENFRELRELLTLRGHQFSSDTDTEVLPHLIEEFYDGNLTMAVRRAVASIEGVYALVAMSAIEPDRIVAARLSAPLVIGLGEEEMFAASDITALIPYTRSVALLGDGEIATLGPGTITVETLDGEPTEPRLVAVEWDAIQAQKNGYPHFLLKEIHEQPETLRNALRGRIADTGLVDLREIGISDELLAGIRDIVLVACGSAWYTAMVTRYALEHLA